MPSKLTVGHTASHRAPMDTPAGPLWIHSASVWVRWPGGTAAWNRPIRIEWADPSGDIHRTPIRDWTRIVQLVFYALATVAMGVAWANHERSA